MGANSLSRVIRATIPGVSANPSATTMRELVGPTPQQLMLANVTGLTSLDGFTSSVQLRFKALGTATWKVDDVYVDPWKIT
jgi:hypothetical protein